MRVARDDTTLSNMGKARSSDVESFDSESDLKEAFTTAVENYSYTEEQRMEGTCCVFNKLTSSVQSQLHVTSARPRRELVR